MGRSLAVVLMTLAVVGCGDRTPGSSRLNSSRQLGDTTFVFSSIPLRGTASLREVSRIGMIEGPPEYLLGEVPMFTVGPDGSLFVADRGVLRLYEADGTYVRTIARRGQGPGEMRSVSGMDVSADGLVAALDVGNRRVNVFTPDGNLVREIRLSPSAGRPGYGRDAIRWDDAGRLWIALNSPRNGPDTLKAGRQRPLFGRLIGHEEVTDTVFLPARAWEGCERRLPAYSGGIFEDNRLPHMPFAHWTRHRTGALAFGCSASYTIDLPRSDGEVRRILREWEPPVRMDEEHRYYSAWFRIANAQRGGDNQTLARLGRGGEMASIPPVPILPRERPAFLRLWLTDDGRVWVRPGATGWGRPWTEEERSYEPLLPGGRLPTPQYWTYWNPGDGLDVFDAHGQWIGHVNTPESWDAVPYPGRNDPYFRGDTIWAVVKEEFDVGYIARFQVEWPAPY